MNKKIYIITGIILSAKLLITSLFASGSASEPFADDSVNPSTQRNATSESTQEWLERRLREVGKLKEGQHLKPHQIWRIVDQLEKKVEKRQRASVPY
jgi:hypothetical protein